MPDSSAPVLLLVDGHSLAYRAYFAYVRGGETGLRTSGGTPTSVSFGFLKLLLDAIERDKPSMVAVAFDTRMPTFRHEVDATYKSGRAETPDEFIDDLQNLREILTALDLPQFELPGYEADDLIGTLAVHGAGQGYDVKILSGDQDLFQLITDEGAPGGSIRVLHQNTRTGTEEFGPAQVKEKLGIAPRQVVDYKALCGDSSDRIPGVRGIGAKGAVRLLEEYGSLTRLIEAVDTIPGALGKKLKEGVEDARHSYWMATIETNVPLVVDFEACRLVGFDAERVAPLLEKLEFRSFLRQLQRLQRSFGGTPSARPAALNEEADNPLTGVGTASADELWFDFAPSVPMDLEVRVVQTAEAFQAFLGALLAQDGLVAWDTETNNLDPRHARLVGIGCAWEPGVAYYLPLAHLQGPNLQTDAVVAALTPYWQDSERPKVLQNAKYDWLVLRNYGVALAGIAFDPMLASYVLDPEGKHNLTTLAQNHLQITMGSYEALVPKGQTIDAVEIAAVSRYCGEDAAVTLRLVPVLQAKLDEDPRLAGIFKEIEVPLEPVLARMEERGIRIDKAYLGELAQELDRDLELLEQEAYTLAGSKFNLGSPKQLSDLLFNKLGLNAKKSRKTSLGYSTDAAVLEKLRDDHPIVEAILSYRTLAKLKSTYVDALPLLVDPRTDRVHTDFNQTVTTTGRLSSSNPNLQNIPVRTSFSRRIRRGFVPEPGWLLVAADYSQIELRILAHLTQEPVLLEAFQSGGDVHTLTARLLLGREEVTSEERRLAKIINYGVVYGMGARRFARETGVSAAEAEDFIKAFYRRYPAVFSFMEQTRRMAVEQGYVETLLGRRRYFRGLGQLNQRDREGALRAAFNAPIQGTAADIIKIAMVRLEKTLAGRRTRLLLQVHDELVFEMPPEERPEVEPLIRSGMENALDLLVPLKVELNAGPNWLEAK
ncbi:DNA polymerase I [Gloeobacter morelensis]|uniref:DNA polymerase I n=1 Tax=Gloeobacter morelensis MG652769 TaxID=2781736 RepID=A0ABY3PHY6_9CYAN|nr:DNA polymerase I [Gloeobacter morelensis]UFP93257.1 DNA polymerase I [Gloeobacter morelensis MG652769]